MKLQTFIFTCKLLLHEKCLSFFQVKEGGIAWIISNMGLIQAAATNYSRRKYFVLRSRSPQNISSIYFVTSIVFCKLMIKNLCLLIFYCHAFAIINQLRNIQLTIIIIIFFFELLKHILGHVTLKLIK